MARLDRNWTTQSEATALATELHKVLEVSHRQAKGIIDAGLVKVNGEVARSHGQRLKPGDALEVGFDPAITYTPLPKGRTELGDAGVELLWEDKHLVFVNKPAGLLTVPTEKGTDFCLAEALKSHYESVGLKRQPLFVVHRLDRHTSGVLVFAKTHEAMDGLKEMFEEHRLQRIYRAILVGEIPENTGTLQDKLIERTRTMRMAVAAGKKKDEKGAKRAITHFRVLERLPGHTVVEVKLETGRRNQIRVQFADRGYPLLGDQVYGEESKLLARQALHAELLGFKHPVTEESVSVTAPVPADFEAALKVLRTRRRVVRAEAGIKGEEGIFKPEIDEERKQSRIKRARRFGPPAEEKAEDRPRRPFTRRAEGEGPSRPRTARPGEDRPRRPFVKREAGEGGEQRGPGARPERPYKKREEGEGPSRPRSARPGEDRPRRPFVKREAGEGGEQRGPGARPERPYKKREEGEGPSRPRSARPGEDRPRRPFVKREEGEGGERRGPGSRPERPYKKREEGEGPSRPRAGRPGEDRPRRPFVKREEGGEQRGPGSRPERPYKKREEGEGPSRPRAARPAASGGDRSRSPKPFAKHGEGGARPAGPKKFGAKPGAPKKPGRK